MLLLALLVLGAAWAYLRISATPPTPWTEFYSRALSRPRWATHFPVGAAQDFVSWAGVCPNEWTSKVQPSINLVYASLMMQEAIGNLVPSFHDAISSASALQVATVCVFYAHALAGVDMTQSEAAAHALMVFYGGDAVAKDANAAASDLADRIREHLQLPLPPALLRHLHAQQAHFQVLLLPKAPVEDMFQPRLATSAPGGACKTQ